MIPERIRICSHCKQRHNHRRRYCSTECKRAAMAGRRKEVSITCVDCEATVTLVVYVSGLPPTRCDACKRKERSRVQMASHRRSTEKGRASIEAETTADILAGELEAARLRLSCQLMNLRRDVMALARDLGISGHAGPAL